MLDESGFPLAGATIQEKETANGAIADSEGKFTLVVADNAVLRVSFMATCPRILRWKDIRPFISH